MNNKKLFKNINMTTGMAISESVGASVVFKMAGSDPNALGVAKTGTSLMGIPSMVHGAGSVIGSLGMLSPKYRKKRKKKR